MKSLLSVLALSSVFAAPAFANCVYPKGPERIPDGNTSTLQDMLAAQKAVKQFDADVGAYQKCLEDEHAATLARDGDKLSEDQKKERQRILVQKQNAAADEAQSVATRFNEQVRIFQQKNKKQ